MPLKSFVWTFGTLHQCSTSRISNPSSTRAILTSIRVGCIPMPPLHMIVIRLWWLSVAKTTGDNEVNSCNNNTWWHSVAKTTRSNEMLILVKIIPGGTVWQKPPGKYKKLIISPMAQSGQNHRRESPHQGSTPTEG